MKTSFDLIVIGGGPAGTAAAITAARAGYSVLLLERGKFPRHKVCGEFVSSESIDLLRWLLGASASGLLDQALMLNQSRVFLDGRTVRVDVSPPAASISRYELDFALWRAAEAIGVAALQNATVHKTEGNGAFTIQSSAGVFQGRAVINATGRWSSLTSPDTRAHGNRWLGFKGHFHGETEASVDLHFFAGGYCGVQPVRGSDGSTAVNVCALLAPSAKGNWDELLSRDVTLAQRSRQWRPAFAPLSTFPITFQTPRPASGRMFNAGDAAGFVDPFVGDGISLALRSGHLAARSALEFLGGVCDLSTALTLYGREYRTKLRPVYNVSSILRNLLRLPRVIRVPILYACERVPRMAQFALNATRVRAANAV